MEKVNYPINMLFYINQSYLTVQNVQKMFYGDDFILDQVIEVANITCDTNAYRYAHDEIKFYRPQHNLSTGEFSWRYETTGLIILRGDNNKTF